MPGRKSGHQRVLSRLGNGNVQLVYLKLERLECVEYPLRVRLRSRTPYVAL
jgi:hypothetical protein